MSQTVADIPHLRKEAGSPWELVVDGEPYMVLGAEVQNSSFSSARYMDTAWENIQDMGVNTVLGPVTWEDVEPEGGKFDFTELDKLLVAARKFNLRLILLWFGSFKNGMRRFYINSTKYCNVRSVLTGRKACLVTLPRGSREILGDFLVCSAGAQQETFRYRMPYLYSTQNASTRTAGHLLDSWHTYAKLIPSGL